MDRPLRRRSTHASDGPWLAQARGSQAESNASAAYTTPEQFAAAAVANYFVWESEGHDYAVSGVNAYYRSILEMSDRGWPGGLRWLHGEDSEPAG